MTISQLCRQWFLIGSVWTSLTAVFLVGLLIQFEPTASALTTQEKRTSQISFVQEELPLRVAGTMVELVDSNQQESLPKALFASPESEAAERHASYFLSTAFKDTDLQTSPERALSCRQSCEDMSFIFYLSYPDGSRIKERHAKNGTLYAKREELSNSGACNARYVIRFEDTPDTDNQLTDFDYNDVVLEVERTGSKLTVRPVYSEAAYDVLVGASLYRQGEFDRDVTIFTSLTDQIQKERQRPGEGTVIVDIAPTLPESCHTCAYACQDTKVLFLTSNSVRVEKKTYATHGQCFTYERVTFIDEATEASIGAIDMRRVGHYVSFVPAAAATATDTEPLPITIQVSYHDETFETYKLYDDLQKAFMSEQALSGSQYRIIDTTRNVPSLQCITLHTSSCVPSCQKVDMTLTLIDSLDNELKEGMVVQNQAVSEREDVLWKSTCDHSYIVKFDDPLSSKTEFQDVWVLVERDSTGITIMPSRYESSRDYRLVMDVTGDSGPATRHLVAPSVSQWTKPGIAAAPFSFHMNLLSDARCGEGISWKQ